ncbi:hypothetical protein ACRDNQ_03970 [Palleronia sp. KMU-117]|uniref:hypothetical protein n=1 Tax=Palleronia sp. KMU-117 TaxID=3434108 RepID=UPI003D744E22
MARLTDITEKNAAPNADYLLHVVDPSDPTDNAAGSSFRMTVANLVGGFVAALGIYFNKDADTADDITEGSTNLFMTEAERSKLSGVQAGATANATNAELRDRATHTGTQLASTISDFSGAADARVAAGIASHAAESDPHTQYQLREEKGAVGGYASLDGTGKVPASQLPSFVDDVIEAADFASLPGSGETGKIYVTLNDNKTFRWSGSAYVEISASPGSTAAVPEDPSNLYFTAARVRETVLTGLSTATSAIIAATDTVLAAFGKLQAQITALMAVVDGKANASHSHPISDVTGLQTALDGKAPTSHSHAISDVTGLQTALDGKAPTSHTHDDRYYTETEVDGFLAVKAPTASPTFTGTADFARLDYDRATGTVSALGNLGATETFDWSTATNFTGTLDQNTTLDFSNAVSGQTAMLYLAHDGVAQRTLAWTPTIKWGGGAAPTGPDTAGQVLVITLKYVGTTYYGSFEIFS